MTDSTASGNGIRASVLAGVRGFLVGIFGLAYAFIIWTATFYLIEMVQAGISGYGWFVLLLPVLVPAVVFVIALALSRSRPFLVFVCVMLAGLGVSAVFWIDTLSYALRNGASLLG